MRRNAPKVIAHRGCADQYPENTVHAINAAAEHVDMFEIDVRRCGSGELVVYHHENLSAATELTGRISETPFDVLRSVGIHQSSEPIPLLTAALDAVPNKIPINVELKTAGIAADVILDCNKYPNRCVYSSFSETAIREIRAHDPTADIAVLCHESQNVDERLSLAVELDCVAFHPSLSLALETDVVERAQKKGLNTNVWTVTSPQEVQYLTEKNVDGIFVDRWDILPQS